MSDSKLDTQESFKITLDYKKHLDSIGKIIYSERFSRNTLQRQKNRISASIIFLVIYLIYRIISGKSMTIALIGIPLLILSLIGIHIAPDLWIKKLTNKYLLYTPDEYTFYKDGFQIGDTFKKYDSFIKVSYSDSGILIGTTIFSRTIRSAYPIPIELLNEDNYNTLKEWLNNYFKPSGRFKIKGP